MKHRVHIDTETRSTVDLRKTSAYEYANHPDTQLLVVRWVIDDEHKVHEWIPFYDKKCPDGLRLLMLDPDVEFAAHNAQFEISIFGARYIRERHDIPYVSHDRYIDTAAKASRQALPRALGNVTKVLKLPVQKDMEGQKLMLKMCKPRRYDDECNPEYHETRDQMMRLSAYCEIDVLSEREVDDELDEMPYLEQKIWRMTEDINTAGLNIDLDHAYAAITVAKMAKDQLNKELKKITSGAVAACTQVMNLRNWCQEKGYFVPDHDSEEDPSLDKNAIETLLAEKGEDMDPTVKRALEIRMAGSRSSVAKYQAMVNRADRDGVIRQYLMYHGAAPGRWAGAGIQPQNFPRKTIEDWDTAKDHIQQVADGHLTIPELEKMWSMDVMTLLSRMLRGTMVAPDGHMLVWGDYSQIEARGVAWSAGAKRLVKLFEDGGKVYEDMASSIYGVPIDDVTSRQRFTGKTAVLGCGYGMGPPKFQWTCERQGVEIDLEEAQNAVWSYRENNAPVKRFWWSMENAAKEAIRHPRKESEVSVPDGCPSFTFYMRKDGFLMLRLPSGRCIYYYKPVIKLETTEKFGDQERVYYWTVDGMSRKWMQKPIWGGHFTENAVQGFCRDIMAGAMFNAYDLPGFRPVLTVHDEVVNVVKDFDTNDLDVLKGIMSERPSWARSLPLAAEVQYGKRYGK